MTYFTTNPLVIFSFCLLFIAGVKFFARRVLHILIHRQCFYKTVAGGHKRASVEAAGYLLVFCHSRIDI